MKFRKKSTDTVIEAVQVTDEWFDGPHPNALHPVGLVIDPKRRRVEMQHFNRETMFAHTGDWILGSSNYRGLKYPLNPDLFEQTFEKVDLDLETPDGEDINIKYVSLSRVLEIVEKQRQGYECLAAGEYIGPEQLECEAILRLLREEFGE